jgi:hypothetical protein
MKREKFDIFSVLWTILLHGLAIVLLLLLHLNKPVAQAESGVPVMLGNMGNLDTDYEFTEVNSMPAPAPAAVPVPVAPQAEPAITQNLEETVAIESGEKEKPVKPAETPKQPTPEELQAQREREVHEQTETQVLDVFARSRNMQASSSTTENNSDEKGDPGSPDGNTTQGSEIGVGGVGPKPQLDGRKVVGVLPVPSNVNIPEAARVVVNIWVDANGKVTKATINSRSTKTMNADLRQRSIEAALKTRFNAIEADPESEDATGTIIYFYEFAN